MDQISGRRIAGLDNRPGKWLFLTAIASLLVLTGVVLRNSHAEVVADPLAEERCDACHAGTGAPGDEPTASLAAPAEQLCSTCHPAAVKASHPSGVVPTMDVPHDLPLDSEERVTCSTCHQVHQPRHGQLRSTERGRKFCTNCHEAEFFRGMADGGVSIIASGHLRAGFFLEGARTDEYSLQCMTCHFERGTPSAGSAPRREMSSHAAGRTEHPVGVEYAGAYRFGGYRSVLELPDDVLLPGGQVSCLSCHEGYSATHGQTLRRAGNAGLCSLCHDL